MLATPPSLRHAVPGPRTHRPCARQPPVRVSCKSAPEGGPNPTPHPSHESRRGLLSQLATGLAAVAVATAPTLPAAALPGFKKDLHPRRRQEIPEDQYTEGPDGVKYYDIVVGTGAEAIQGSRVAVHFDAKWKGITFVTSRQGMGVTGGTPLGFDVGAEVGAGGTLKGLDRGVRGMRVGGQRRLLVPPNLAYGKKGYGEVPPNATLTVDVALLSIKTNPFRKSAG